MNDSPLINEQIKVITAFGDGLNPCRPIKFRRKNGNVITVTEIGLRHPTIKGKRMIHIFDVTDGLSDYRLEFDAEGLSWRLTREADNYDIK